jgi:hypothetical protein
LPAKPKNHLRVMRGILLIALGGFSGVQLVGAGYSLEIQRVTPHSRVFLLFTAR